MSRHWKYLKYLLRHKLYVYLAGRELGLSRLQLLLHDWQKLAPQEWLPYVRAFYGNNGTYSEKDATSVAFDYAWLHHQKLGGKHHWQYWLMVYDEGRVVPLPMPDKYRHEMLADWRGAGRALGKPDTTGWYQANAQNMQLHPETRRWIEQQLGLA